MSISLFPVSTCYKHLKPGVIRGHWKLSEDEVILKMVSSGLMWKEIASELPGRIGENVRERYVNHLDPTLKKTKWTKKEDDILFENQRKVGNKWSEIRKLLPGRSDNAIKNRYHNRKNSVLRKIAKKENRRKGSLGASDKSVEKATIESKNFNANLAPLELEKSVDEVAVHRTNFQESPVPLNLDDFPDAVVGI